jgi:predicted nucleic acid-binding protein
MGAVLSAARFVHLVTTARTVAEASRRVELGLRRPDILPALYTLIDGIQVVEIDKLAPLLPGAGLTLKEAVASNNGSVNDAHLVALAWSLDADIWTTDRDFAGTGIASWSTPNLMRALQRQGNV